MDEIFFLIFSFLFPILLSWSSMGGQDARSKVEMVQTYEEEIYRCLGKEVPEARYDRVVEREK